MNKQAQWASSSLTMQFTNRELGRVLVPFLAAKLSTLN